MTAHRGERPNDERESGRCTATRSLIHNMVVGVTEGYEKRLEIWAWANRPVTGPDQLEFSSGYSTRSRSTPRGITFNVEGTTRLGVQASTSSWSARSLQTSASCASPSLRQGRALLREHIRRKVGKAGK